MQFIEPVSQWRIEFLFCNGAWIFQMSNCILYFILWTESLMRKCFEWHMLYFGFWTGFFSYNFSLRSRKYLHLLWRVWCSANIVSLDSVLSQCSNMVKCLQHSLPLLPSTNLHPPFTYIFFHCSLHLLQFWIFCEVCGMNVEVLQIWIHLIQFSNCGRLLYK